MFLLLFSHQNEVTSCKNDINEELAFVSERDIRKTRNIYIFLNGLFLNVRSQCGTDHERSSDV